MTQPKESMVKKKRLKKAKSIKITKAMTGYPLYYKLVTHPKPQSEIKKRELIYFRRPCSRCDKMFTPTAKTGKICSYCFKKK